MGDLPSSQKAEDNEVDFQSSEFANSKAGRPAEYFVNIKKSKRPKFTIKLSRKNILISSVIIILLGATTIFLTLFIRPSADTEIPKSQIDIYEQEISTYIFSKESSLNYEDFVNNLENYIEDNRDSENLATRGRRLLASLHLEEGNYQKALDVLNQGFDETSSDQIRLSLLSAEVDIYLSTEQTEKAKDTISQILSLPENLKLEYEEWSIVRDNYRRLLSEIEAGNQNYE